MSEQVDLKQFLAGLEQAEARAIAAAKRALVLAAEHVKGESQRLTPIEWGTLQNSATVGPVEEQRGLISIQIGHNTSYAAAVHEILTNRHKVGQAKYLETAMRKNTRRVLEFIQDEVSKAL